MAAKKRSKVVVKRGGQLWRIHVLSRRRLISIPQLIAEGIREIEVKLL